MSVCVLFPVVKQDAELLLYVAVMALYTEFLWQPI